MIQKRFSVYLNPVKTVFGLYECRRGSFILETLHKETYALENKVELASVSFNIDLFPLQMAVSPTCFVFCNRTQLHVRKIGLFSKLNVLPGIRSFLLFE